MPITAPRGLVAHHRRQQADRVGRAAGPGIVLHIGQHDRLLCRLRHLERPQHRGIRIEQFAVERFLLRLHRCSEPVGGSFDCFFVMAIDDERGAALRNVRRRKSRRVGHADDALVVTLLARLQLAHEIEDALGRLDEGTLPDQRNEKVELAIGAIDRPFFLQQPVEQFDRPFPGHRHVDVRVGSIADHGRRQSRHLRRQIRVIVEARDDRQIGADDAPDAAQQFAFAVLGVLGHHRAMQVEVDRIERPEVRQVRGEQLPHAFVGVLGDVGCRRRRGPGQRDNFVAEFAQTLHRAGDRDVESLDACDHFRSMKKTRPGVGADEIVPGRLLRRKSVRFVLKAANCNPRHRCPRFTIQVAWTISLTCAESCPS